MMKAVVLHNWVEDDEEEGDVPLMVDLEAQKERIRQIIAHQKYLFLSSSSSSSSYSSSDSSRTTSTSSSSQGSISLRELMKSNGTSLRRLFDAEHTTFATHIEEPDDSPHSACSPPSLVWERSTDSDCDDGFANAVTSWSPVKPFRAATEGCRPDSPISFPFGEFGSPRGFLLLRSEGKLLTRKRSYKTLPAAGGLGMWRCRGLGFRLRSPPRLSFRMRSRRRLKAVGDDSHLAMVADIV